jgi:hypothetical protein
MGELRAEPDSDSLRIRLAALRALHEDRAAGEAELLDLIDLAERRGSAFLRVSAQLALGDLRRWGGDTAEAARRYEVALTHVDGHTFAQPQLSALIRASASMVEPEAALAARLLRESLDMAVEVADMPVAAAAGVAIAAFRGEREGGDPAAAATALGAAAALRGLPGADPDIDRLTALLRSRLGEAAYAEAYARGEALPREAAIAELRSGLAAG